VSRSIVDTGAHVGAGAAVGLTGDGDDPVLIGARARVPADADVPRGARLS
jgi:tetrahydrodipicolinate N-succinyltransferase